MIYRKFINFLAYYTHLNEDKMIVKASRFFFTRVAVKCVPYLECCPMQRSTKSTSAWGTKFVLAIPREVRSMARAAGGCLASS